MQTVHGFYVLCRHKDRPDAACRLVPVHCRECGRLVQMRRGPARVTIPLCKPCADAASSEGVSNG